MSSFGSQSVDELAERAKKGDQQAVQELLDRNRPRLVRMVRLHMDPRIQARVDASDIVQDSLIEACRRLRTWLSDPVVPLYPWLRQITWEKLAQAHRQHLRRQKRSVSREVRLGMRLPDESIASLSRLVAEQPSPSEHAVRAEMQQRVREALDSLSDVHREVLVMRYLEQMTTPEIAACLTISEGAVRMRQLRAIEALRKLLDAPHEARGERRP